MARFFADENFPLWIAQTLRRLGHDVLTTRESGLADSGTSDPEILEAAMADGRAILTHDRFDFMRLHRQRPGHAGIVICTADSDFARLAQRIHDAISAYDSLDGMLIRVTRPGPGESSG